MRSRRVGIATYHRLLAECGTAAAALEELPALARAAGLERYSPCSPADAEAELRDGRRAKAQLVFLGEPAYPAALAALADAPPLLWVHGQSALLARPMVAVVGARNASSLGTRMARRLAIDLGAAGYVVASGLARGVDTAAHHGALTSGTAAVLAGGIDVIYPPENAGLARDIAAQGVLLSEQRPGLQPQARHFPARNRLVSGLARAVVVVEAAARSGTLITARTALDQGREVLAVPGHPLDGRAAGCCSLIRDGATLVRSADDILEVIGPAAPEAPRQPDLPLVAPDPPPPAVRPAATMAELHRRILEKLGPSPLAEDQLIRDLAVTATALAPALTELELDGAVTRQPGGLLSRSH
ncbi:DNA processing protein DprA, putative [Oceanicola granulosus HTCC2516]|uniref:DNA processing protein DprA, putative n=1 Tax=Oceanicola granulosus (strain ATCC BAA-861 / DSM 15982 / KCTC 12143 / HTCC2516) TaxID=314256 RepID=Q2CAD9_OCEGH|nr:DNA processing protein DprA, putative [Oceanicola granulosus HTCC2516]